METKKFRVAVVGCGAISKTHAESLQKVKNAEIVAFCDVVFEKAQEKVNQYGGKAYYSFEDMLIKEKPDVLHICTPHYLHVPMAIAALRKKINVVMEKPPAISKKQYEELEKYSDKALLGICFQNRYNGSVRRAKEILETTAGEIKGARAFVTWARNADYYTKSGWRGELDKEGGGVLINQSIHTLDLLTYFLGRPTGVYALSSNNHLENIINEEDTINAYLKFDSYSALFYATTAYCKDSPVFIEIVCENCTIRLEGNTLNIKYKDNSTESYDYSFDTTNRITGKKCWGASHTELLQEYYSCLEKGKKFSIGLESTKNTFDTMMAIYESASKSQTILIGD